MNDNKRYYDNSEFNSCYYCKKLHSDDFKDYLNSVIPYRSYYCEAKKDYEVPVFQNDGRVQNQLRKKCCSRFVQGSWTPNIQEVDFDKLLGEHEDKFKKKKAVDDYEQLKFNI